MYFYKTSDGVRHEAEISSSSRDAAFAALRRRGIRPIKVSPKGGDAARSYGWRTVAAAVCLVATAVGAATWLAAMRFAARVEPEAVAAGDSKGGPRGGMAGERMGSLTARPRGQIEGYAAIDLEKVFRFRSERRLAEYARPGIDVRADAELDRMDDLPEALETPLVAAEEDSGPVRELKRIVVGLKDEARAYIRGGHGTAAFADWLSARQRMETDYKRQLHARARSGLISRSKANEILRAMAFPEIE